MSPRRAFVLALGGLAAAVSWVGCGGASDDSTAPSQSSPASVVVTPTSASLRIGQTEQLRAEARDARGTPIASLPAGMSMAWSSSDTTIVVVSPSGQARAVRDGAATLTAAVGQVQGSGAVTVTAPRAQLEVGARASGRVGPKGGTITATAGGKRYVLTIPAGALRDSTDVSVTPITSMENLPVGATLLAGADFAPSGLRLAVP